MIIREDREAQLAARLLQFEETLTVVAREGTPHVMCAYLYDLAGLFSGFYEHCPILSKSLKYMNDESKIKYACEMVNKIDCGREQPKIAGLLLSILSKDAYRNNESIHDLIWGEVIKNIDVFLNGA